MAFKPTIRALAILVAALFLFAQALAYAHAADHGHDHDHDGVACSVMILGEEDGGDLPVPTTTETMPVEEQPTVSLDPTRMAAFDGVALCRAPPPRAPPAPLHA